MICCLPRTRRIPSSTSPLASKARVAGSGTAVVTVRAELRRRDWFEDAGGETFLAVLQEEGTVATQVEAYVHILREAASRRELLALGGRLIDGACNGQPVAGLLAELRHFELVGVEPGSAQGYIDPLPDFLAEPDPPSRFVFSDLLPADVMLLLHGEPRSRKSLTAVELALGADGPTPVPVRSLDALAADPGDHP